MPQWSHGGLGGSHAGGHVSASVVLPVAAIMMIIIMMIMIIMSRVT